MVSSALPLINCVSIFSIFFFSINSLAFDIIWISFSSLINFSAEGFLLSFIAFLPLISSPASVFIISSSGNSSGIILDSVSYSTVTFSSRVSSALPLINCVSIFSISFFSINSLAFDIIWISFSSIINFSAEGFLLSFMAFLPLISSPATVFRNSSS
ncbi:unnamed protein product, partial [Sphagnum jensenii]